MTEAARKKIVIVGGGFGGIYAALELDKWLFRFPNVDVTIVTRDNFFLFTPLLARNVLAELRGEAIRPFRFKTIGQLASLGRRTGAAQIFGVNFSGFAAWWMWRTIYLMKLPRLEKRLRVAIDWTWDLIFSKDLVQFLSRRRETISQPQAEVADAMRRAAG